MAHGHQSQTPQGPCRQFTHGNHGKLNTQQHSGPAHGPILQQVMESLSAAPCFGQQTTVYWCLLLLAQVLTALHQNCFAMDEAFVELWFLEVLGGGDKYGQRKVIIKMLSKTSTITITVSIWTIFSDPASDVDFQNGWPKVCPRWHPIHTRNHELWYFIHIRIWRLLKEVPFYHVYQWVRIRWKTATLRLTCIVYTIARIQEFTAY